MTLIPKLKQEYVEYYRHVPIQKYAALAIARDEDTVIRWKKSDKKFADAVKRAQAEWVRKKVLASKAEFALERLESEIFSKRSSSTSSYSDPFKDLTDEELNAFINRARTNVVTEKYVHA